MFVTNSYILEQRLHFTVLQRQYPKQSLKYVQPRVVPHAVFLVASGQTVHLSYSKGLLPIPEKYNFFFFFFSEVIYILSGTATLGVWLTPAFLLD